MSLPVITLCHLDDIGDGDARGFDPFNEGRDTIFVVRHGKQLHGYRNSCPHVNGAPMAWRKDAFLNRERSRIVCSAHGAQFEIATGLCTLGPCLGQSLVRVPLRLADSGAVDCGPLHEHSRRGGHEA